LFIVALIFDAIILTSGFWGVKQNIHYNFLTALQPQFRENKKGGG